MLRRLWRDTHGAVISSEVAVVGTILLLGVIVGLGALKMAILSEAQDVGQAIHAVDFTPKVTPVKPTPASADGSGPTVAADLFSD